MDPGSRGPAGDSNQRPPDYESAKEQAVHQQERAEEAERAGLIVPILFRQFSSVSNLKG